MACDRPSHKWFLWFYPTVRFVAFVGFFGAVTWGCRDNSRTANSSASKTTARSSASQLPESLPRILELGADACIPCRKMVPVLDELEREYQGRLEVQFIDVYKFPSMAKVLGVQSIPVQIFYDAWGKEIYRHEGFIAKEDILNKWRVLGVDLSARAARL